MSRRLLGDTNASNFLQIGFQKPARAVMMLDEFVAVGVGEVQKKRHTRAKF